MTERLSLRSSDEIEPRQCLQAIGLLAIVLSLLAFASNGFAAANELRKRAPITTIFSVNRTLSKVRSTNADGSESSDPESFRWTYGLTLVAGGSTGWSGEFGLTGYADTQQKGPGSADFSYVVGYRPASFKRLKFGYDNYGANQFRPNRGRGENLTSPSAGVWAATLTLNKSSEIPNWLKLHSSSKLGCSAGPRYQRRYSDSAGARRQDRFFLRASCKYVFYKHLFLTIDTNFFQAQRQFSGDGDFTFEVGWNSYANRSFALLYRNYAANRFPWRSTKRSPRWRDGALTVQWRLLW